MVVHRQNIERNSDIGYNCPEVNKELQVYLVVYVEKRRKIYLQRNVYML